MEKNNEMSQVYRVRPLLGPEEAAGKLKIRSLLPPFRKRRFEKIELVFLPHYLFKVAIDWKGGEEETEIAVDAVHGHFAIWTSGSAELEKAEEADFDIPFLLNVKQAQECLMDQYRWVLVSTGMKLRKSFKIRNVWQGCRIYFPFWAAHYRSFSGRNFEIADAVNGMRQGGKVRDAVISAWLASGSA